MIAWDSYVGSVGMYPLYICVVWIWRLAWEFVGVFPMHLVRPFVEGVQKRLFFVDCSSRKMDPFDKFPRHKETFESWPTWMNSV